MDTAQLALRHARACSCVRACMCVLVHVCMRARSLPPQRHSCTLHLMSREVIIISTPNSHLALSQLHEWSRPGCPGSCVPRGTTPGL